MLFRTPLPDDPVWLSGGEEWRGNLSREIRGNFFILRERVEKKPFIKSPEETVERVVPKRGRWSDRSKTTRTVANPLYDASKVRGFKIRVDQWYVHLLDSRTMRAFTLKFYIVVEKHFSGETVTVVDKHRIDGKIVDVVKECRKTVKVDVLHYADSRDFNNPSMSGVKYKPKSRENMRSIVGQLFGLQAPEAEDLIQVWINGWDKPVAPEKKMECFGWIMKGIPQ